MKNSKENRNKNEQIIIDDSVFAITIESVGHKEPKKPKKIQMRKNDIESNCIPQQ